MEKDRVWLSAVTSVIAILTTGCGVALGDQSLDTNALSAPQVVQDYYAYIAQHDPRSAAQFLTPALVKFYHSAPDSDFNNVRSISHVTVTKPYATKLDDKYRYEVQVDATFTAQYDQVITDYRGSQMRFIYLGRNSTKQPWEIISIGTGP